MKKESIRITKPDELNKHLQHSSPFTWIVLGLVIASLVSLFVWSFLCRVKIKLMGKANVESGAVTLHVQEADLYKLQIGQKVFSGDKNLKYIYFDGTEEEWNAVKKDDTWNQGISDVTVLFKTVVE